MKDKQLFVINEGDDDSNLWVVADEQNESYFSSRSLSEANKFISNFNQKQMNPNSENWENSFISELARENCLEMNEVDCLAIRD